MLVETMNALEVHRELITDLEYVQRKGKIESEILRKAMLRKKQQLETCAITYKTPRRNDWNLILQIRPDFIKVAFYIKGWDRRGLVAYSIQFADLGTPQEDKYIVKYSAHFFQRYNERMLLGFSDSGKVIKHFFKRNFDYEVGQSELLEDGTMLVHFVFKEGIGIGWKDVDRKTLHFKTFIANSTLTRKQQSLVANQKHE